MTDPVKRPYVSAKRDAQARATRKAILEAATRLFPATGYVATTIQAVADEADVAVQTVYAVFGNKRELLRQVLEAAVVGDADVATVDERADVQALANEPDPRRRAQMSAAISAAISQRIAPIARVLSEAAAADPEFATAAAALTEQRRADMAASARLLAGADGLKVSREDAIGTLYVLYSPGVFTALTVDLGWSVKRYEKWLATMLYRTLLA
ncbi:MAG TPA: helix-turn-helix domain-containing protein [Mycobacteriales bacterium]|nr:helix-turn-helix domain-containing protein [Mycobacteriales bacterium]